MGRIKKAGQTRAGVNLLQTTVKAPVSFTGIGLHTGVSVRATVHPAAAEYGIWFRRTDVHGIDGLIAARWDSVDQMDRCTRLTNRSGASVSTVEHMMAALAGCGIHNAIVDVDGPELPALDGSSQGFVAALVARGLRQLDAPVRVFRVLETVEVRLGDAWARLDPADSLEIDFRIEFPDKAIGTQTKKLDMANGAFVRELCNARTFGRLADVEMLRAHGLAQGGSLDNAIVVDGGRVLNPDGLRYIDEPVRHKMLDALGDLALAGAPLIGCYTGHRAGHALTNSLLREMFARPGTTRMEDCDEAMARRLPGMGVRRTDVPSLARAA